MISPSDHSRRCVGVVRSLEGDFASSSGTMRVGIRDGIEVAIPFTKVADCVSKLIGNFYILDADADAIACCLAPIPATILSYVRCLSQSGRMLMMSLQSIHTDVAAWLVHRKQA